MAGEWYEDHTTVVELAWWLDEQGLLTGVSDTVDFFAEPWKWGREFELMVDSLADEKAAA